MDGNAVRTRWVIRTITAFAVLLGIFAMHGLPMATATGCHGGAEMVMSASSTVEAVSAPVAAQSDRHGDLCVFVQQHSQTGLSLMALTALLLIVAWLLSGWSFTATPSRGPPPPGGVGLLLRLSVSRT